MKSNDKDKIKREKLIQKILKNKIDGNQKSEDNIWNKNQMKSNDRDKIKNKINL